MEKTKKYIVQNMGTPRNIMFPRVYDKGAVVHEGRPTMYKVKDGDIIELTKDQSDKLIKIGYLKEHKKGVK